MRHKIIISDIYFLLVFFFFFGKQNKKSFYFKIQFSSHETNERITILTSLWDCEIWACLSMFHVCLQKKSSQIFLCAHEMERYTKTNSLKACLMRHHFAGQKCYSFHIMWVLWVFRCVYLWVMHDMKILFFLREKQINVEFNSNESFYNFRINFCVSSLTNSIECCSVSLKSSSDFL